jgi:type IV fimbrial biogenesis protein FimT
MIGIAIMAILLAVGLPGFKVWMLNTQIRTATESMQNGLQLARAEAVRRNEQVNFILGTGTSWTVSTVAGTAIQSRPSSEGSVNVTVTATPAGATTATFNALGRLANPTTAPTQIDLDVPTTILPANESRELRINITSGGQIRTCDPIFTATDDPRKC